LIKSHLEPLLRLLAKMFQKVPFEEVVDQTAFLGEDTFDDLAGQVSLYDPIAADAESVVARETLPKRQAVASLGLEAAQSGPDFSPGLRSQGVDEALHLLPHLDPVFHSPRSSRR
jgi:hypothetical protein